MKILERIKDGEGAVFGFSILGHRFDLRQWYRINGDPEVVWYLKDEIDDINIKLSIDFQDPLPYSKVSLWRSFTRPPRWLRWQSLRPFLIGMLVGALLTVSLTKFWPDAHPSPSLLQFPHQTIPTFPGYRPG